MWNKYIIELLLVLLFKLFSQNLVFTQVNDDFILVDSKLWDEKGDTTEGKLIYVNQYNFQFNLVLADTSGNVIKHYSPKDLAGFYYMLDDQIVEYESMLNPVDIGRVFLRVLYKGSKSMYQFLDINYKSTVLSYLTYYYLWEDKWLDPPISAQNETPALLYHFSDCPELEYKIKTSEYSLSNIRLILQEYQECKLTDEYEFFYE
jgi:hypothetical protein